MTKEVYRYILLTISAPVGSFQSDTSSNLVCICLKEVTHITIWFMPKLLRCNSVNYFRKKISIQKQPSRGIPRKRFSKNIQQIYWRTPMTKCDFKQIALQLY